MSLFKKMVRFASSRQGRWVIREAKKYAQDQKTRQKLNQAKDKLLSQDKKMS